MNKDIDKKGSRLRRARRGRMKARELNAPRLTVYRSPRHIYAQIVRFSRMATAYWRKRRRWTRHCAAAAQATWQPPLR